MAEMTMANNDFDYKKMIIQYQGYKGINFDNISVNRLNNLKQLYKIAMSSKELQRVKEDIAKLPNLSLDEIRNKTYEFCTKYFDMHDIYYASKDSVGNIIHSLPATATSSEAYGIINSVLESKSSFDLDINLVNGHAMVGQIIKPIPILEKMLDDPNRKVFFSNIEIGDQLNLLSVGTLVHEIAHSQQEHIIGYAEDYLNKEIISIFLEKVCVLEEDPTKELLKLSERNRLMDILNRYATMIMCPNMLTDIDKVENLLYIKSALNAEKLFDLYLKENKQKNKDKFFYLINDVFNGKITVEDLLRTYNISINNSQDLGMLKRHLI